MAVGMAKAIRMLDAPTAFLNELRRALTCFVTRYPRFETKGERAVGCRRVGSARPCHC